MPSLAVWAPTAREAVDGSLLARASRWPMERGEDGVWRVTRRRRPGATPSTPSSHVDGTRRHRPVFGRADAQLDALGARRAAAARRLAEAAADPRRATPRSTSCTSATSRSATRRVPEEHRGTYLAFTHDSAGMRHLRTLAEAGLTTVHLLPCNDIATIEEDRSRQLDPGPARPPAARLRRAAAPRSARCASATASTGATTRCTTSRPRAPTRVADRTREFRAMVRALNGDRPARRARRRLQPHAAAGDSRPGPDRPRLLPPAHAHRRDLRLDLLREHRDRAPDDGEADARRARALGARVPRRRLPLRPHGPPHEGQPAGGARAARAGRCTSTARAGASARSPTTRCSSPPRRSNMAGHRDRHVQRRRCATPSAAAARTTPTRPSRAAPPGDPAAQALVELGLAGHLQPRRLRRAARRRDRLRRRARQRDAVRRARAQAPARPRAWTTACGMNTLALATVTLSPEPVLLARRRRPAALEVAGPQLLRLRRLVQPDRLDRRRRRRGAPGLPPAWDNEARWPFMRPLLADPALKPQPHHIAHRARARAGAAADPLLVAALPARRRGAIRRLVRFEPGAPGRDRDGARGRDRRRLQRDRRADDAGRRRARASPAPRAGRARVRPTPTARSRSRRGPSQCSFPELHRDRVDDVEATRGR